MRKSRFRFAGAAACMVAFVICGVAFAAAPGRHVSGDYLMSVDGRPVDVVRVPMPENCHGCIVDRLQWQPYSYAPFVATGEVSVCVRSGFIDLSKTQILPVSKGVVAISNSADTVTFRMRAPMTLVLEPRGRHRALVVSANPPETDRPKADDPKVRTFGPGFHRAGKIRLGDGETLYLADGAWVEGYVVGQGRDIAIRGTGVLSGADGDWGRYYPDAEMKKNGRLVILGGENVTVRDVTFFSPRCWTLTLNCVTNALVDNLKVIGGRVLNDDGIDICRGRDVTLRNSFVRTQDDCIAPKWWCENLVCTNMTLWTDAANAFRIGYECEDGRTGLGFRNMLFRDIDVLHLSLNHRPAEHLWANCAIYVQPSHGLVLSDVLFDDLRFHDCGPKDIFLAVKTLPIEEGPQAACTTKEAGHVRSLVLRNIALPPSGGGMCVYCSSHDDDHAVKGVRFENVTGYGPVTGLPMAGAAVAGGWCYRVGECEAWQLKLAVEESDAALCKVGWPGRYEYPAVEPEGYWSATPVDGYDFIPGERDVPPHRCVRPVHEVAPVQKDGLYDLGREEIGFVVCEAHARPKLFVGESVPEARNGDWNGFEQVTLMDRTNGVWRSRHPLALRYFRFDCSVKNVRFLSEVDRREPRVKYDAPNPRAAKIWRTAVETLRLSTRTFLMDGPKRDRLPWMGDFVVSCLANAASFADPEPCKRTLVAVGTPARLGHVNGIGAYSLWWVVGHGIVQQKFPDRRFLQLHYPRIKERVDAFDRHVDARGYYTKDLGWNFLDWADSKGGQLKSEMTLQVVYFAALKSAVRLAGQAGDTASAKAWEEKAEALRTRILADGMDGSRQARALAIVFDLVDGETARCYAAEIAAGNLPPTVTPYMATMEVWALMKAGEVAAAKRKFESVWGRMADLDVGTFWEGFDPAQTGCERYEYYARPYGKSLCHAWSAGPAFLLPMFPALAEGGVER